jgi:hypothetical protein
MRTISKKGFLSFLDRRKIGFDVRNANSHSIGFIDKREHHRFWEFPFQTNDLSRFLFAIIDGISVWRNLYVWPKCGSWPKDNGKCVDVCIRNTFYRQFGVKMGSEGALICSSGEKATIVSFLFIHVLFVSDLFDDLFLIPDNGRFILGTDHHGVITVRTFSGLDLDLLIKHMKSKGFELPNEVPDDTFRKPEWMP